MIIANKYEIPDHCPKDCRLKNDRFSQSSMCVRCPIFNCSSPIDVIDEKPFFLIDPQDYRSDWAKEWQKFFAGEIEYPELPLEKEDDD